MLLLLTLAALVYGVLRDGSPAGMLLLLASALLQLYVTVRLAQATATPAGAHAEWVRTRSTRPRLLASPLWTVALLLAVTGLALMLHTPTGSDFH